MRWRLLVVVVAVLLGLAAAQEEAGPRPGRRRAGGRGKRTVKRKGRRSKGCNWQCRIKKGLKEKLVEPYLMTRTYFPDAESKAISDRSPRLWSSFNGEPVALQRPAAQRAVARLRALAHELEQAAAARPNASGIEMMQQVFARASSTYGKAAVESSPLYAALTGAPARPTEGALERLFEGKWLHMSGCSTMRQLHESLQKGLAFNGTLSSKNDTCWASPRWQVQRDYNFLLACRTFSTAYDATHDGLRSRMSFSWKDVCRSQHQRCSRASTRRARLWRAQAMFGWGDAHVFSQWATRLPDVLVLNSGIHQFHYEPDYFFRDRYVLYKNGMYKPLWMAHYANQTAMLIQTVEVLRETIPGQKVCVVWKANNVQPNYVTHMDVMNTLTIPYLLDAGINVIDPSPVTKANKRVKDVHHHWEIFTPKILVPFLSAIERMCGTPLQATPSSFRFSLDEFYRRLNADIASRRTMSVDPGGS